VKLAGGVEVLEATLLLYKKMAKRSDFSSLFINSDSDKKERVFAILKKF
jgi:hypothetical protein